FFSSRRRHTRFSRDWSSDVCLFRSAALLATGYNATEMKEIIETTPFRSFMQRAPIFNMQIVGPALRLLLKKGLYAGNALEQWVRSEDRRVGKERKSSGARCQLTRYR